MMLRKIRIASWALVGIAAVGGLWVALRPQSQPPIVTGPSVADIGGPFTLTGADAKPFASSSLAGKPYAIFFGFTHCPDVCPTTLARLARLRTKLGHGDDSFAILFVSVDPERDTPIEIGRYAALFATPIVALTGSASDIDRVKKLFGVYSAKAPQDGGGYTVDHTASVFLIDRTGKFAATIAPDEGDAAAIAKLKRLAG